MSLFDGIATGEFGVHLGMLTWSRCLSSMPSKTPGIICLLPVLRKTTGFLFTYLAILVFFKVI